MPSAGLTSSESTLALLAVCTIPTSRSSREQQALEVVKQDTLWIVVLVTDRDELRLVGEMCVVVGGAGKCIKNVSE